MSKGRRSGRAIGIRRAGSARSHARGSGSDSTSSRRPGWTSSLPRSTRHRTTRSSRLAPAAARSPGRWRRACAQLVAVEIDRDLAAALPADVPPNVRVVQGDFLDVESRRPASRRAAASTRRRQPSLQRLVADPVQAARRRERGPAVPRCDADAAEGSRRPARGASPGPADYGTLAIQVALLADVERLLTLPPGAFRPPPKVTSAVVRLRFHAPSADVGDPATFERIVRGVFLQRRKTLANALKPVAFALGRSAPELLERAGLDGSQRPEELTVADMARLSQSCAIVFSASR